MPRAACEPSATLATDPVSSSPPASAVSNIPARHLGEGDSAHPAVVVMESAQQSRSSQTQEAHDERQDQTTACIVGVDEESSHHGVVRPSGRQET